MRKLAAFWLKFLVFLCLLAIAVNATGTLLSGGDDVTQSASSLKHLPAESVDVLWLGTSHMNYNIIPQYLYDLCGVTSAMATGNSVDLDASYWMLRQALLTQSPQVIVLDVYPAAAPYCYFYVQNVLALEYRDGMSEGSNPYNTATGVARWLPVGSPFKPGAIAEAYTHSGAGGEAYFELTRMHSRYGELTRNNFDYLRGDTRTIRNFGYLYGGQSMEGQEYAVQAYTQEAALQANEVGTYWEFTDEQLQAAELLDASVTAIRRIVEYARDKGIEIVLCAAPYMTNRAEEKLFAQVGELADELGVPFVGLEESGIEGLQYMRDLGHLNDRGARLYTEFWSDYLADHYDLPDRHESADSRYTPWREGTGRYDVQRAAMSLIGMETGLTGYLEALAALDGDYLVLISAQGDVYEGFTESDWLLMTEMLGMNGEAVEEWYYTGTGTLDGVCCGGKMLASAYAPEGRTKTIAWNLLGHEITFEDSRWSVDGNSAGSTNTGMNIAVYSLPDHMLMDCRTFDMTQIAWDE